MFNRLIIPVFFFVALVGCGDVLGVVAQPIKLAAGGTAYSSIFVAGVDVLSTHAGDELKKYLEQLSGAPFIVTDELIGQSIVVGPATNLRELNTGAALPVLKNEEYGIVKRGGRIYLMGGTGRAVLYAVYDFLSTLGCRWVAPEFAYYEGMNRAVPRITNLDYIHNGDRIELPAFKYRKLYIEEGLTHNVENLLQLADWMPKARFNVLVAPIDYQGHGRVKWDDWREELVPEMEKRGIAIEIGGHGYQNFLNAKMENGRLYAEHPEWFGVDDSGERSADPHVVFCTSNADARIYLHNQINAYLDMHPEAELLDFWPPDSERWCTCASCEALGTPTDRHALLVNQTAHYLRERHPNVRLECLAYHHYTKPPTHVALDSTVLLDFCPIDQHFEYQIYEEASENNKRYNAHLLDWLDAFGGDISIYSYYRKYAWCSLPNIIPHYMQHDLIYYRDIGVNGISVYSEPGDWFTYGVNHYVLGHLAWEPAIDVDSLIREYCTTVYGESASTVAGIYAELEQIVRFGADIRFSTPKSPAQYREFIDRLEACITQVEMTMADQAQHAVSYRHLNKVKLMVEYAVSSIRAKALTAEGRSEAAERVAKAMKRTIHENKHTGVFIPR